MLIAACPRPNRFSKRFGAERSNPKTMLQDLLGSAQQKELVETVGLHLQSARQIYNKECRQWGEFIAVLKPPQLNLKHIEQRVTTNAFHYRVNYAIIALVTYFLQVILHPFLLLALLTCFCGSFWALFILKKPVVLGGVIVNENGVKTSTVVLSVLFLALMGSLEQLLWASLYSIVLCALHMVLRPRSVTSKTNLAYEQMKVGSGFMFSSPAAGEESSQALEAMEAGGTTPSVIFPKHE